VRYSGTHREHAIGNSLIINNEDIPTPRRPLPAGHRHRRDGSQIRFTLPGHFVLDKRTGEVRRNTVLSTCRSSGRLRRGLRLRRPRLAGSPWSLAWELIVQRIGMGSETAVQPTILGVPTPVGL
jgi:hypothetical protein